MFSLGALPLTDAALAAAATVEPLEPLSSLSTAAAATATFSADSRAVWLWGEEMLPMVDDPDQRAATLDFLDSRDIDTVYLFAAPVGGLSGPNPMVSRPDDYAAVVSAFHDRGIQVFALFDAVQVSPLQQPFLTGFFQDILDYNSGRPAQERFDGVNLDFEPWGASTAGWEIDYLDLAEELMDKKQTQDPGLLVGVDAPFWSDTRFVTWRGSTKPLNEHIQDTCDYITILDYRDFALGSDGILSHAFVEVTYGAAIGKPVVIGVETQLLPGQPEKLTFFEEGEDFMESQLLLVKDNLASNAAFGGVAIHHVGSYRPWASQPLFSPEDRAVWASSDETFDMLDNVGGFRSRAIDFMIEKGITTVYLFVGNENPISSSVPEMHLANRAGQYESLIADLHGRGLTVFALIGGNSASGITDLLTPGGRAEQHFQAVLDYNADHVDAAQRFDGINLDLEPWVDDPLWATDDAKKTEYLNFASRVMEMKLRQEPTLPVGPASAHWFGNPVNDFAFEWNGKVKQIHQHVLDTYDYATVMAFRDQPDFLFNFALEEVAYAESIGKTVVVGVETTPLTIDNQTFFEEGELFMEEVLGQVKAAYLDNRFTDNGFGGYAIQDLGHYIDWTVPETHGPELVQGVVDGVGQEWVTVQLPHDYRSMVVIATANYDRSDVPGVVRVRNADGNSFQVRVEPTVEGQTVEPVSVRYLVVEEGVYNQAQHGITMEAVRFTSTLTDHGSKDSRLASWVGQERAFLQDYSAPAVFGQVMSANDPDWSVFWSHGEDASLPVSGTSFWIGKHSGEDPDWGRVDETLGYIVVESGTGFINGMAFAVGSVSSIGMNNNGSSPRDVELGFVPANAVVSQTGMIGRNGGWAVLIGDDPVNSGQIDVRIDEDQAADIERSHTTETSNYFIFERTDPHLAQGVVAGVGQEWVTVELPHNYRSMVVVASANYDASHLPGVVRIRNAEGNSFQISIDSTVEGHVLSPVDVHYTVVEEGVYNRAEHGITMEAVRFTSTVTDSGGNDGLASWWIGQEREFLQTYTNPLVFGQVMSANDPDWSAFWSRGEDQFTLPSKNAFFIGKHVGEDPDQTRADETIGYIVVESGRGTVGDLEFKAGIIGAVGMENPGVWVHDLDLEFTPSNAVVTQTGMAGPNGGWAVMIGDRLTASGQLEVRIDEDQAGDLERTHMPEVVNFFILGHRDESPHLAEGVVSDVGQEWVTVELPHNYRSMVVVATANYDRADAPGVVRVQNADSNSFQIRIDPTVDGQTIEPVSVHYLVVEEGVYNEAEHGISLEAVRFTSSVTDHGGSSEAHPSWVGQEREFLQPYTNPLVFGQVMSANDPAWSVFWSHGDGLSAPVSADAFFVGKHTGEDPDWARVDETLGYIVIEAGIGSIDGVAFAAGSFDAWGMQTWSNPAHDLDLGFVPSSAVLSQTGMAGHNGGWAVLVGSEPTHSTRLSALIDEDQASDLERTHTLERINFLVFG